MRKGGGKKGFGERGRNVLGQGEKKEIRTVRGDGKLYEEITYAQRGGKNYIAVGDGYEYTTRGNGGLGGLLGLRVGKTS